jgi:DNA-binding response OmpR family regulator
MDGRQMCSAARDAGVACPIVFCSAYGAVTAKQQLGAEGAIEKPFEPEQLLSAIRALTG